MGHKRAVWENFSKQESIKSLPIEKQKVIFNDYYGKYYENAISTAGVGVGSAAAGGKSFYKRMLNTDFSQFYGYISDVQSTVDYGYVSNMGDLYFNILTGGSDISYERLIPSFLNPLIDYNYINFVTLPNGDIYAVYLYEIGSSNNFFSFASVNTTTFEFTSIPITYTDDINEGEIIDNGIESFVYDSDKDLIILVSGNSVYTISTTGIIANFSFNEPLLDDELYYRVISILSHNGMRYLFRRSFVEESHFLIDSDYNVIYEFNLEYEGIPGNGNYYIQNVFKYNDVIYVVVNEIENNVYNVRFFSLELNIVVEPDESLVVNSVLDEIVSVIDEGNIGFNLINFLNIGNKFYAITNNDYDYDNSNTSYKYQTVYETNIISGTSSSTSSFTISKLDEVKSYYMSKRIRYAAMARVNDSLYIMKYIDDRYNDEDSDDEVKFVELDLKTLVETNIPISGYIYNPGVELVYSNYINDGGSDMYDTGNILFTNLCGASFSELRNGNFNDPLIETLNIAIPYTHTKQSDDYFFNFEQIADGVIVDGGTYFGDGSSYFTNMYEGVFVLGASNININEFFILGDLGADGTGFFISGTFSSGNYKVAYISTQNSGDPRVNKIVIVPSEANISIDIPNNTNLDDFMVSGLSDISSLYYFLVGTTTNISQEDIEIISASFIQLIDSESLQGTLNSINMDIGSVSIPNKFLFTDYGIETDIVGFIGGIGQVNNLIYSADNNIFYLFGYERNGDYNIFTVTLDGLVDKVYSFSGEDYDSGTLHNNFFYVADNLYITKVNPITLELVEDDVRVMLPSRYLNLHEDIYINNSNIRSLISLNNKLYAYAFIELGFDDDDLREELDIYPFILCELVRYDIPIIYEEDEYYYELVYVADLLPYRTIAK